MPAFSLMGKEGSALLDSALALPRQSAFGKEAYPTILDKAAVLFRSLVRNHCLVDGNKRVATAATVIFLIVNGRLLLTDQQELIGQALKMASPRGLSWRTMSRWLRGRSFNLTDQRLARSFIAHLEAELRHAQAKGSLTDADLRETVAIINTLPTESTGDDFKGSLLVLWKQLLGKQLPEAVVALIRRSLEASLKESSSR